MPKKIDYKARYLQIVHALFPKAVVAFAGDLLGVSYGGALQFPCQLERKLGAGAWTVVQQSDGFSYLRDLTGLPEEAMPGDSVTYRTRLFLPWAEMLSAEVNYTVPE